MSSAVLLCGRLGIAQTTDPVANLVALDWTAPDACPSGLDVGQRVRELAGVLPRREPLRARGRVAATANGVRLHLETRDAGQTFVRDVDLSTCAEAAETAALILAMALRAETPGPRAAPTGPGAAVAAPNPAAPNPAGSVTDPAAPNPAETTANAAAAPPKAALPDEPRAAASSASGVETPPGAPVRQAGVPSGANDAASPRPAVPATQPAAPRTPNPKTEDSPVTARYPWSIGAGGSVAWAVLPDALWATGAWGALTLDDWRVEVAAVFAPPQRASVENDATRGGEFVVWSAGLRGCYVVAVGQPEAVLRGLVCAGAEGGQLRARGFGTTLREQGVSPWWALDAGLGGLVRIAEHVTGVLRVELVMPLWRDSFVLRSPGASDGRVAQPSRVVGRLGLGVEVAF